MIAMGRRRTAGLAFARGGIRTKLVHEFDENRVGSDLNLMMQAGEKVRAPFGQVGDPRCESTRMQAEAKYVDRWPQQGRLCADEKRSHRAIGGDQRPMPIDGQGRIRFMPGEHQVDGLAGILQRGLVKLVFRKDRSVSRRDQENVAFAQGHFKLRGEMENHFAAWLCAAVFEKTQVPGGNFRVAGEVKLAQAAPLPPFAEKIADGSRGSHNEATIAQALEGGPLRQR